MEDDTESSGCSCKKLCVSCGPCWIPLCFLSCLPCCCYCSCLSPYNKCRLRSIRPYQITVDVLAPGNENVRAAFGANFQRGLEQAAQLVVYHDGEKTLDLAGITLPEDRTLRPYDGDSLSIIYSSGKVLAAIAVCILVDNGELRYDEKICNFWPEFAKNGKENIRVEDVMRHDSGLFSLSRTLKKDQSLEEIGEIIENSKPLCQARVYHAYSRGLIINQICIRCDHKKRTMARLLEDEIFSKIGLADDFILAKAREKVLKRVHPFTNKSQFWEMANITCPSLMGCNMPWTSTSRDERNMVRNIIKNFDRFNASLLFEDPLTYDMAAEQRFAADPQCSVEVPSAWFLCTARLMAKCAALMSQGGVIDGVRIFKQETVEEALSSPTAELELNLNSQMTFTKGGFGVMARFDNRVEIKGDEFYGWCGLNGSMMMFQYRGGKPGGCAFGYNCTGGYKQLPNDIRGSEICRQLGVDLRKFDGPKSFLVQ